MPACGCSCPGPVSVLCEPVGAGFRVGSAMVGHTHTVLLMPLFPLAGVAGAIIVLLIVDELALPWLLFCCCEDRV
jgi:hypothetical protein